MRRAALPGGNDNRSVDGSYAADELMNVDDGDSHGSMDTDNDSTGTKHTTSTPPRSSNTEDAGNAGVNPVSNGPFTVGRVSITSSRCVCCGGR